MWSHMEPHVSTGQTDTAETVVRRRRRRREEETSEVLIAQPQRGDQRFHPNAKTLLFTEQQPLKTRLSTSEQPRPRRGSGQREVKGAASSRQSPVGAQTQTNSGAGLHTTAVPVANAGLPSPLITEIIMLMLTALLAPPGSGCQRFSREPRHRGKCQPPASCVRTSVRMYAC